MQAEFKHGGVEYRVSGHLWAADGAANSMLIYRQDGRAIPGEKWWPGHVQTGVPDAIEKAAERALEAARRRAK